METQSFSRYGITLLRLRREDNEILRSWRNNPYNAMQMREQAGRKIGQEEQKAWFERIKNSKNAFYFIAYYKNKPIGCLSIKNIDWDDLCGDPGSVFDSDFADENPIIKFCCEFASHDFYFEELKLDFTHTFVKNSNKQAIRYNKFIGYEHLEKFDENGFSYFKLSSNKYFETRNAALLTFRKVYGDTLGL